jgi:hypothetical protein
LQEQDLNDADRRTAKHFWASAFITIWVLELRSGRQGCQDVKPDLNASVPIEIYGIKEIVMAKIIECYRPKKFEFVPAAQTQPGEPIEFCSRGETSVSSPPVGGILGRRLAATESDHAVGSE